MKKSKHLSESNSIGARIRIARRSHKMSIEELAASLNVSESYIGLIERNDRSPSLALLVKLSEFFSLSLDYIVHGREGDIIETCEFGHRADIIITRFDISKAD